MSFSPSPRDEYLASTRSKAKWLACTKRCYFKLSQIALRCPPVSHNFCYAGFDPENLNKVTYGSNSELDKTLLDIYAKHGPVDLRFRGCDTYGNYYLKCLKPGLKYGPAKAVICVLLAKMEKGRTVGAETEASQAPVDGNMSIQEGWEEVIEEDDWVRV